jgi:hypothetical protein
MTTIVTKLSKEQFYAQRKAARTLLAALEPFAKWARGIAQVEQQDAFTYRYVTADGTCTHDVLADDFARVLSAIAAAKAAGIK